MALQSVPARRRRGIELERNARGSRQPARGEIGEVRLRTCWETEDGGGWTSIGGEKACRVCARGERGPAPQARASVGRDVSSAWSRAPAGKILNSSAPAFSSSLAASTARAASVATSTAIERTSFTASRSAWPIFCSASAARRATYSSVFLCGFLDQQLGLALGGGDDVGGFLFGFLALLLIFGEQLLRLLAQAARLVELVADLGGALVQRLGDHARHLHVDDDAEEDDQARSSAQNVASMPPPTPAALTAAATAALSTLPPISGSTIAAAVSSAIVLTSARRRALIVGDLRLGLGELALELGLDRLALGLGLGLGGVAAPAGRSHWPCRALRRAPARRRRPRRRPPPSCAPAWSRSCGDALAADLEDAADARQRHPLQEQVEEAEGDRQPQELRREVSTGRRAGTPPLAVHRPRAPCPSVWASPAGGRMLPRGIARCHEHRLPLSRAAGRRLSQPRPASGCACTVLR